MRDKNIWSNQVIFTKKIRIKKNSYISYFLIVNAQIIFFIRVVKND
jgi:hypothetical protein